MQPASRSEPETISLSVRKTRRDLRLSIALLIAGVVLLVAYFTTVTLLISSGNYTFGAASAFVLQIISGSASALVTVGAIFTAINYALLRRQPRGPA